MSECNTQVRPDIGLMLITANVGSLFEDPTRLLKVWLNELIAKVAEIQPHFLALHLQEVGGKTYEKSMEYVQDFIRCLCDAPEMKDYSYVRIYMDEDFKSAEHFTALGNIYFAHKDLESLRIWNFFTHAWEDATDRCIYSGNIETIATKEKSKFPQHFFPECKWSRKGFMRTRWEINETIIDLVNIHLFHDASNLAACEEFPSVYCKTRRRALVHTLERFHLDDKNGLVPFFVFGDFNFRCDTEGVVKELTENLTVHRSQSVKSDSTKVHYRNSTGNNVLTIGKKEFSHADHQLKFKENWLKKFDREQEPLRDVLIEYPITFAPSYPFEEDPDMPTDYMSTRCPSWCDRILMSPQAKEIININVNENDAGGNEETIHYKMIGESVCMGDHKPIYLSVRLKPNKGTYTCCDCNRTYTNNNKTFEENSAVSVYCPYISRTFNDTLAECKELNRKTRFNNSDLLGKTLVQQSVVDLEKSKLIRDSTNINTSSTDTDSDAQYSGNNNKQPPVSINIIDTDNIYVCMCAQLSSAKAPSVIHEEGGEGGEEVDGSICPECRNIIKKQPVGHRYRLISKRLMLSENIIVNRIDTQHLSTYFEHSKEDPYTPESNESHSPYPEMNSSSTTTSSNSRSPFERISPTFSKRYDDANDNNKKQNSNEQNQDTLTQENIPTKALNADETTDNCDNHSRGVVSPVQLKSRLEDLQRLSMQNLNSERGGDRLTAEENNDDESNEETFPSKSVTINRRRAISSQGVPESLELLVNATLGDEVLWKEQSQADEPSTNTIAKSRYVKIRSVTGAATAAEANKDNDLIVNQNVDENDDDDEASSSIPQTPDKGAVLKETTV